MNALGMWRKANYQLRWKEELSDDVRQFLSQVSGLLVELTAKMPDNKKKAISAIATAIGLSADAIKARQYEIIDFDIAIALQNGKRKGWKAEVVAAEIGEYYGLTSRQVFRRAKRARSQIAMFVRKEAQECARRKVQERVRREVLERVARSGLDPSLVREALEREAQDLSQWRASLDLLFIRREVLEGVAQERAGWNVASVFRRTGDRAS